MAIHNRRDDDTKLIDRRHGHVAYWLEKYREQFIYDEVVRRRALKGQLNAKTSG